MRRSERHHALLDVLRANAEQVISVPRLAGRFAVSTRTIERDIRALQEAGVPIYAHPGRTGGYAIRRDYSLPPLAFTAPEATAVVAGLSAMLSSPFADDSRRAMDKVLGAMPPRQRTTARALAGRIASLAPERTTSAEIVEVVREVLISPRVVELEYVSHISGERTRRTVEPLGMITVRGSWILVGWCRLRHGVRGFLTEQTASIRTTEEVPPVRTPDPFDADLARWDFLRYDRWTSPGPHLP